MGEEFGEEWLHVYVWLDSYTIYLKIPQYCLLIGYIPKQNKKLKKKFLMSLSNHLEVSYNYIITSTGLYRKLDLLLIFLS